MFQRRLDKLRQALKEKNIDAFLVSNFYNILYLSGFKTLTENEREAWMLITQNYSYLFSDSRYLDQKLNIKNQNDKLKLKYKLITPEKGLIKHLQEIFKEEGAKSCGVEAEDIKIFEFEQLKKHLPGTKFIPTDKLIIKQREIKDEVEIEKIKKACEIADQCLQDMLQLIEVGKTEKEIAFQIEFWLKEKNYDLAFYPIVAVDENSAIPHYDTRGGNNRKVKKGSVILIDFGAKYQDYLSDITRMVFVGKPDNERLNTYNKLLTAQTETIQRLHLRGVRQGVAKLKEIDYFCREKVVYPHSTGHGVGLEIHEYPKISPVSEEILLPNQIITIEPGIYFEGRWGMRIEDTVLVKENNVEVLTKHIKDLLIV